MGGAFPWWILLLPCFLLPLLLLCREREKEEIETYTPLEEPVKEAEPEPTPEPVPPPPPPPAPEPAGVRIDFVDPEKTIYMEYKPLGIIHEKHLPIIVKDFKFNSYALYKGVTKGSRVTRVANEDLDERMTYDETMKFVGQKMSPLEVWPLPIEFETPDNRLVKLSFKSQPLGFEFTKTGPFKITTIAQDGVAAELGVQLGYQIVRIGTEEVKQTHTFEEVKEFLTQGSILLPASGGGRSSQIASLNG